MANKQEIKEAIADLVEKLEIRFVVYVDDLVDQSSLNSEKTLLRLVVEPTSRLTEFPEFSMLSAQVPEEIKEEQIRRAWPGFEPETQLHILQGLGIDISAEKDVLQEYFEHSGAQYSQLMPWEWDSKKEGVIDELNNGSIVILFDEKLGDGERAGMELIVTLLQEQETERLICGLISRSFRVHEEYDHWISLAEERGIDRDRFALISKDYFEENNFEGFFSSLRRVLLNNAARQIKEKVAKIIADSFDEANRRVRDINIFDFEHIVFASSQMEGIWEPDTLIRLFGIFQRAEVLKLGRADDNLWDLVARIRYLSQNHPSIPDTEKMTTLQIRHAELYEETEFLAQHHMPLELGDIFEKTDNGKLYILIGQPCDLMVRSDGKRGESDQAPDTRLVEIKIKEQALVPENMTAYYKLPYYSPRDPKSYYVHFGSSCTIDLKILDLCVYSKDGQAFLRLDINCPNGVIPAWEARYERLIENFRKLISLYGQTGNALAREYKELKKQLIARIIRSDPFSAKIDPASKTIEFDVRRVCRLRQPDAAALLTSYAVYLSRAAFEHDFGRGIPT